MKNLIIIFLTSIIINAANSQIYSFNYPMEDKEIISGLYRLFPLMKKGILIHESDTIQLGSTCDGSLFTFKFSNPRIIRIEYDEGKWNFPDMFDKQFFNEIGREVFLNKIKKFEVVGILHSLIDNSVKYKWHIDTILRQYEEEKTLSYDFHCFDWRSETTGRVLYFYDFIPKGEIGLEDTLLFDVSAEENLTFVEEGINGVLENSTDMYHQYPLSTDPEKYFLHLREMNLFHLPGEKPY
jgi:hypothetical protein